jgi:hypothetical protein
LPAICPPFPGAPSKFAASLPRKRCQKPGNGSDNQSRSQVFLQFSPFQALFIFVSVPLQVVLHCLIFFGNPVLNMLVLLGEKEIVFADFSEESCAFLSIRFKAPGVKPG